MRNSGLDRQLPSRTDEKRAPDESQNFLDVLHSLQVSGWEAPRSGDNKHDFPSDHATDEHSVDHLGDRMHSISKEWEKLLGSLCRQAPV
jgi:hypothetical protein